jgi:hypothetical protein
MPKAQASTFRLVAGSCEVARPPVPGLAWIQALYTFTTGTPAANCSGSFRLLPTGNSDVTWQFWTISSTVESLIGYEYRNPLEAQNGSSDIKTQVPVNGLTHNGTSGTNGTNGTNGHVNGNTAGETYDVVIIGAGK